MKRLICIAMLGIILAACNEEAGSYATIVFVNDIEYNGTEEQLANYEIDKMKGKLTKKVPANVFPANNQSNSFDEGTIVYSVKGESDFVIVEDPEGKRYLMQQAPGSDKQ